MVSSRYVLIVIMVIIKVDGIKVYTVPVSSGTEIA